MAEQTRKPPKSVDFGGFHWGLHPLAGDCSRRRNYASVKFRVTDGSTGIPGPVVVETVTFLR